MLVYQRVTWTKLSAEAEDGLESQSLKFDAEKCQEINPLFLKDASLRYK